MAPGRYWGNLHWRRLAAGPFLFRFQAVPDWRKGLTGAFPQEYNFVRFAELAIFATNFAVFCASTRRAGASRLRPGGDFGRKPVPPLLKML
jgi:hypothetical protein